jgi:DNA mismatch repair protein MutL
MEFATSTTNRILPLGDLVRNQIAAGEVIEGPFSVVKELIENSLDASANQIEVSIQSSGFSEILVTDDGEGISSEDLPLSLEPHATSKIRNLDDISRLTTFGFRGEALASIASVSRIRIQSCQKGDRTSHWIENGEGVFQKGEDSPFQGTRIYVKDLFFNAPVRRKFLKSQDSEERKIKKTTQLLAMAAPSVQFKYYVDGKMIFHYASEPRIERILRILGEDSRSRLIHVQLEWTGIRCEGWIGDADNYRSNRSNQYFFMNQRPVELKFASSLLKRIYGELLPDSAHPVCFLYWDIDPSRIDPNVHPQKKEIRFIDESMIQAFFHELIHPKLFKKSPVDLSELSYKIQPNSFASPTPSINSGLFQSFFGEISKSKETQLAESSAGLKIDDLVSNPDSPPQNLRLIKHFGVIFETFILAYGVDGFYIIDQHAAHERIRYEEILNHFRKQNLGSQKLLTPLSLNLSESESGFILSHEKDLGSLGFLLEEFGKNSWILREVPHYIESGREIETLLDYLNRMENLPNPEPFDTLAKCIACSKAIKKGDLLSDEIISETLNRLSHCEEPTRCPHGRPTLVRLTQIDLEKLFHRK